MLTRPRLFENFGSACVTATGLLIVLGSVLILYGAPAYAACPPYTPDLSLVERFLRSTTLSPEQKQRIETIVRQKPPDLTGELAQLELLMKMFETALTVSIPISGPSPLTVDLRWGRYPIPDPAKIEFDMDGDGMPEWTQPGYDAASGPRSDAYRDRYTYQKEGEYQLSIRIYDRAGQVTTYRNPIRVVSLTTFDSEIQTRWTDFKDALRRGDIAAALECIHTHSRGQYHEAFSALAGTLPQTVDQVFPAIRLVSHDRSEAIYEAARTDAGLVKSFDVRFGIDVDGVWRISAF